MFPFSGRWYSKTKSVERSSEHKGGHRHRPRSAGVETTQGNGDRERHSYPSWTDFLWQSGLLRRNETPPALQVSRRVNRPILAAGTTMAMPTRAPTREGNSAPRRTPVSPYGMVKARPVKRAKGVIASPSFQLLLRPKKRVSIITIIRGIKVPTMAWPIATSEVMSCRNISQLDPPSASCRLRAM